MVSTNMRII